MYNHKEGHHQHTFLLSREIYYFSPLIFCGEQEMIFIPVSLAILLMLVTTPTTLVVACLHLSSTPKPSNMTKTKNFNPNNQSGYYQYTINTYGFNIDQSKERCISTINLEDGCKY